MKIEITVDVIVLIILGIILLHYIFLCTNNKTTEGFDTSTTQADVSAIRNLNSMATELMKPNGTLTNPGNLTVTGALSVGSLNILPSGSIIMYNSPNAPAGWALCDGGSGRPDLRGRFVLGYDPRGGKANEVPGDNFNGIGNIGGAMVHKLLTSEMPSHNHTFTMLANASPGDNWIPSRGSNPPVGNNAGKTDNTGGDGNHNNMPPYYVLTYIIKL